MSNKFFGQYLLELGIINKHELLLAIDLQKASHLSLGEIAINKGYLTQGEATAINLEQQRTDERFGSLAVSMGHLISKQVSELFIMQQNLRKFFGEVLVEQNIVSKPVLLEHLEAHADLKRKSTLKLDSAVYAHKHGKFIADAISVAVRLFLRVAKTNIQVSNISTEDVDIKSVELAFSQETHIPDPIKAGFIMEQALIQEVANHFLNFDIGNNPEVSQDAVCEFLNIILGNALASHCKEGVTSLSPPVINEKGSDLKELYQSCFSVEMATPDKNFVLFFYF